MDIHKQQATTQDMWSCDIEQAAAAAAVVVFSFKFFRTGTFFIVWDPKSLHMIALLFYCFCRLAPLNLSLYNIQSLSSHWYRWKIVQFIGWFSSCGFRYDFETIVRFSFRDISSISIFLSIYTYRYQTRVHCLTTTLTNRLYIHLCIYIIRFIYVKTTLSGMINMAKEETVGHIYVLSSVFVHNVEPVNIYKSISI